MSQGYYLQGVCLGLSSRLALSICAPALDPPPLLEPHPLKRPLWPL